MILVLLLTGVVYPLGGRRHPSPEDRGGMFIAGASYVIVAWIQQRLDSGVTMSVLWQACRIWS